VLQPRLQERGPKDGKNIILRSLGKSYIFVYLGGRLSLDLNWSKITDLASKGISRELNRLKKNNLTISDAAAVASSVFLGYVLRLCGQSMLLCALVLVQVLPLRVRVRVLVLCPVLVVLLCVRKPHLHQVLPPFVRVLALGVRGLMEMFLPVNGCRY
jgi:hypothetical protein